MAARTVVADPTGRADRLAELLVAIAASVVTLLLTGEGPRMSTPNTTYTSGSHTTGRAITEHAPAHRTQWR